jgi:4-methyl-5(b-hydroxyethyl)-thiazole monophosphate biosynthesis
MKVVVPMAEGFEEIEFVTIVDILRRAEVEVVTASLGERKGPGQEIGTVEGSHGIKVVPDAAIDDMYLLSKLL